MGDSEIERRVIWLRAAREIRSDFFDPKLFINPAWDILLEVYQAALEERRISVSDLAHSLPIPLPTALRWIDVLVGAGLISYSSSLFGRGAALLELTQRGISQMDTYFHRLPPVADPC